MSLARTIDYRLPVPDRIIVQALRALEERVILALKVGECPVWDKWHPRNEVPGAHLTELSYRDRPCIEIIHMDQVGTDCRPFLARYAGALETAHIPHVVEDASPTREGGWYGRIKVYLDGAT